MFAILCDRPCQADEPTVLGISAPQFFTTDQPNTIVVSLGLMGPLVSNNKVTITVRATDKGPIRVLRLWAYVPPIAK
jgi:hypothetical protein